MAAAKKTVKMFGTGNFVVDGSLYAFRDGEEVECRKKEHEPFLIAEAKRREAVFNRSKSINEAQKAN